MYFNLDVVREKKYVRNEAQARNTESALITILIAVYCRNALEVTTRVYTYIYSCMYIAQHAYILAIFTYTLSHAALVFADLCIDETLE